ncbi:MAG TPA: DUF3828 domain-containing protein, partial [Pyrinomonadaceae bacterium]|nr:DUF3828 domain-containing protein [Pyrinomonadaceae bacterium]
MKYIIGLAMLLLIPINLIKAETPAPAQASVTPAATVRSFYQWYLHALNQGAEPLEKQQAELDKFVTQRLLKALNRALKRPDGIDADFFIDAQDWDDSWEKNISTSKAMIRGTRATVSVKLKGGASFGNTRLSVGLRKEDGV